MTAGKLIDELAQAQSLVVALLEASDDQRYRQQAHPDLSPLGWHLGHCVFIECYWLHEVVFGNDQVTQPLAELYTPPRTPKAERGARLPPRQALLDWAQQLQAINRDTLQQLPPAQASHRLFEQDYLQHFLIQHYSQHYETMLMILTQQALQEDNSDFSVDSVLESKIVTTERADFPAGHYRIGGEKPLAYDNELPPQRADLGPFSISRTPVSNAEYLGFMEDGGYRNKQYWDEQGWQWQKDSQASAPDHWRQDTDGHWFGIGIRGAYTLAADEPVMGINYHEASAFANWAGARLPHEYQWETACRLQALENAGRAWEWCSNSFQPYQGYVAFPYKEYSQPWFDGEHYSLRGGSLYTRPPVRRPSFRNFYQPDKRHIFAGLRLVW